MAEIKTITSTASESSVTFSDFYPYVWIKNTGDTAAYVSPKSGITAGGNDVAAVAAGDAVMITAETDTVYVKGATTLEVHGQGFAESPFLDVITDGGGSSVDVESITITSNGTTTAPSGKAYTPITVNVPTGAEIISRNDWDALTTAQKQAKGLVAIQDASTGFKRGELVNGADYVPIGQYIPNSDYTKVTCEAYADNFDASANSWGMGTNPVKYLDNSHKPTLSTIEDAVYADAYTSGAVPFVDLGDTNTSYTAYAVVKFAALQGVGDRLVSCMSARSAGYGIVLYGDPIKVSKWGDEIQTSVDSDSYVVVAIKNEYDSGNATKVFLYAGDTVVTASESPTQMGRYFTIARTDLDASTQFAEPANVYVRYVAMVSEAEADATIEANVASLYSSFIGA